MKAYLITTGTVFGLITLAHIWRVLAGGPRLATDPLFVLRVPDGDGEAWTAPDVLVEG